MADARGSTATIRLGAQTSDGRDALFGASGTVITFRGFIAAYEEGRDEVRNGGGDDDERRLPELAVGDALDARDLRADGHSTSPPPRYTEASLVKSLEELGIGRPSTYAATISVIVDRGYVTTKGSALVPTWLAFAVTRLLEQHFGRLVDYDFTAAMEADLDRIAAGEEERGAWLSRFYFGDGPKSNGAAALAGGPGANGVPVSYGLKSLVDDLGDIDARDINSVPLGEGIVLRVGRYGPYLEVIGEDGEPKRASVPDEIAPDELNVAKARELLETQADGDRVLGTDPDSGREIVVRNGRFGPYVTEVLADDAPKSAKPRTGSLFKDMNQQAIGLDDALKLLSLPRLVGVHPETNEEITAQNGRYGPYLKSGTDSRSLETEDQIFDLSLDQALAIYAQPKQMGRRAATAPLRELGNDPVTGTPVVVKDGRFGAYVTDGTSNATLRKDDAVETITLERAAEMLADKRAAGPRRGVKKTTAKKAAVKKTAVKKAPAKKSTSTTTATKRIAATGTTRKTTTKKTSTGTSGKAVAKKSTAKKMATKRPASAGSDSTR
jgi:DNA topoisomerase-1